MLAAASHRLGLRLWPPLLATMSARLPSVPSDPERRVRSTLKKVFGFDSFKTPLQESATMAVVKGNALQIAALSVFRQLAPVTDDGASSGLLARNATAPAPLLAASAPDPSYSPTLDPTPASRNFWTCHPKLDNYSIESPR